MPDLDSLAASFAPTARRLCEFVTAYSESDPDAFLEGVLPLVAQTYAEVSAWPPSREIDAPQVDSGDGPDSITAGLDRHLGPPRRHHGIFDPFDSTREVIPFSIADDLSGIRDDLLRGLRLFDAGNSASAVWEWRFNFEVHWGHHAGSCIRAIHAWGAHHTTEWFGPDD